MNQEYHRLLFRLRIILAAFILGLLLSGITAFPLVWELGILHRHFGCGSPIGAHLASLAAWIDKIYNGLNEIQRHQPFMFYGTDWLALAHLGIALAFWGAWRDPVRNIWLFQWGMLLCLMILPLALICGPLRGIPFFWQIIDCQFGIVGIFPLYFCYRYALKMQQLQSSVQ